MTDVPISADRREMKLQGVMPDAFHCNEAEVLVSGPRGTSKTYTDMLRTIALCKEFPGSRHLFARYVRAHMAETVLETWERLLGPNHPTLAGGPSRAHRDKPYQVYDSEVIIRGLDDPIATNSGEFDTITLFEGTDIPETTYFNLFGTLRHGRMIASDGKPMHQMRVECNPGAPQHWLKKRADSGMMTHFPTTHQDNPAYWDEVAGDWTPEGANYIEGLKRMTGVIYKRNFLGLWAGAEGMIYEEWDEAKHVVDSLPPGCMDWEVVRSIDFGYVDAFVCQWWAISRRERAMILVKELVRHRTEIDVLAREVNEHSRGMRIRFTVADHADAMGRAMLGKYGIPTQGCEKPRAGQGWAEHFEPVMQRLRVAPDGSARLYVYRRALIDRDPRLASLGVPIGLLEEIPGYAWLPPKEGKAPKEEPQGHNDHSCFVAGTLVETEHGPVPIERICVGDRVWTRRGLRRVEAAWCEGAKPTHVLTTTSGKSIEGTGDHPIWTVENGFVRMDALQYAVHLVTCARVFPTPASLSSEISAIAGIPAVGDGTTACTTPRGQKAERFGFTWRYGRVSTGPCPRDVTSTTAMGTRSTTTSPILSAWRECNTFGTTGPIRRQRPWPRGAAIYERHKKPLGRLSIETLPLLLLNGRMSLVAEPGAFSMWKQSATVAGRSTRASALGNTAGMPVERALDAMGGQTTSNGNASADESSPPTGTPRSRTVPDRVLSVRPTGRVAPVFNLTVEDAHEYFAGGVLVSNCAAMRYAVHGIDRFYVPEPVRVEIAAPLVREPVGVEAAPATWVPSRFTRPRS